MALLRITRTTDTLLAAAADAFPTSLAPRFRGLCASDQNQERRTCMFSRLMVMLALSTRLLGGFSTEQMDEYRVKAAFFFNFAKFVDWAEDTSGNTKEPFVICVLGQDLFGRALDDVVAGKTIAGRSVTVRRITDAHRAGGCRVLFISPSEGKRVLSVITETQRGVLTVGDAGNATSEGVVINFILEGGKIHFEINMTTAEQAQLHLSSRLLSLATVIRK